MDVVFAARMAMRRMRVGGIVIVSVIDRWLLATDVELRGAHARADDPLGPDSLTVDCEASERTAQIVKRQPRIEQGAEDHVTGGARKAVKVQNRHARPSYRV